MFEFSAGEIAIVGLAVVFVGIAKAGFGGGIGILTTPMIALVIDPKQTIGIMLPILCACDLFAIPHYWRTWNRRQVAMLVPGMLIGVGIGSLFLGRLSKEWLGFAIGALSVAFVIRHFWLEFRHGKEARYSPGWAQGVSFGAAAGVASTLAHAAGPVTTMYLLPQKMEKTLFVGTTVIFYTMLNGVKLIPYTTLQIINWQTLKVSLAMLVFVPMGVWLGVWLNKRIDGKWFSRIVYVILFLAGVELIQKNLGKLLGGG